MAAMSLNGTINSIRLEYSPREFCEVFLECEDKIIKLGIERLETIVSALLVGINTEKKKKCFTYGNKDNLFTIITLTDPYTVIAGIEIDNGIEINFIDQDGKFLSPVILENNDIYYWKQFLTNIIRN